MTTKVITGKDTRFSYLNANEPKAINGGKPKYSVSLIISKDDVQTIDKIKAAIEQAYKEGESKLKGNGKSVPSLESIENTTYEMGTWNVLMMKLIAMPTS